MAAQRARLGLGHALAWVANGLAGAALVTDAVGRDGGSLALAIGAACAVAAAALGLLAPVRVPPRMLLIVAAALALLAAAAGGALALLQQPPQLAVAVALGLAAGAHTAVIRVMAGADPALAPRVRPAPTLLAAALGAALVAVAAPLAPNGVGLALVAAAVLQLLVVALAAAPVAQTAAAAEAAAAGGTVSAAAVGSESAQAPAQAAPAPALLALLAIASAGAVALMALRPGLSAIGADDPQPAGPLALTLALGALLGPPLAMLAARAGGSAATALATVGGAAALIAPIARPGALDWVAAAVLGVALAASVALAELARRSGLRLPRRATALLVLAGAAGAGIAALLLAAVPLPDVVLGAALACLLAGIGVWMPSSRPTTDDRDGRRGLVGHPDRSR